MNETTLLNDSLSLCGFLRYVLALSLGNELYVTDFSAIMCGEFAFQNHNYIHQSWSLNT